jgi:hypothetical protein
MFTVVISVLRFTLFFKSLLSDVIIKNDFGLQEQA